MLTNYAASKLTNHLLGISSFTMPANVYLVLFTADPTVAGAFTNEVASGRGYARQAISGIMDPSVGGAAAISLSDVLFGPCSSNDWGLINYMGLADSVTRGAGNLLTYKALSALDQRAIRIGDKLRVPTGSLSELFA